MLTGRLFAGRRFSYFRTWAEAKRSFDMTDEELARAEGDAFVFWRWPNTTLEVLQPTQEQLKKDI
jgi:hypothetical protein